MGIRSSSPQRVGTSRRIRSEECRVRRLLHVALLLMIILGIRGCGGMAVTEDRLGAATRAMADKVGLANKKDAFDAAVRPPMAAATQSLGNSIFVATARTVGENEMAARTVF